MTNKQLETFFICLMRAQRRTRKDFSTNQAFEGANHVWNQIIQEMCIALECYNSRFKSDDFLNACKQ